MPATPSSRAKDQLPASLDAKLIACKGKATPASVIERPAPPKPKAVGARTAAVTFRVTAKDFLRLQLGAAQLETSAQDVIIAAINDYLDRSGVMSSDRCVCLRQAGQVLEHATGAVGRG